jgi:hypothetical protein
VRRCQRLIELDRLLSAVLNGDAQPASARERLELVALCQMPCKRLHATALRLAADAFAAEPKRDYIQQPYRYNLARSAVLAAAGQAAEARIVPDKLALRLRQQALRWLHADLALYARLASRDDPRAKAAVRQRLTRWRNDADLAWVRDQDVLQRLDGDEQTSWRNLWAQVDGLLARTTPGK